MTYPQPLPRSLDRLYHATPLHYVPAIFVAGALYAKNVLAASPPSSTGPAEGCTTTPSYANPRRTARRRDLMLHLGDYVHLSPRKASPLLTDKIAKGYPHAVLVFDGPAVLAIPETAVLPYNTKAWLTRAAYAPVTDSTERDLLLRRYLSGHRFPSLEILVKYGLSLAHLHSVAFINDSELRMTLDVLEAVAGVGWNMRDSTETGHPTHWEAVVDTTIFGTANGYEPRTLAAIAGYFDRCRIERTLLSAPNIEFD